MRLMGLALAVCAAGTASPCLADPPLAGVLGVFTASHGQAFCADPVTLNALRRAHVAEAPLPLGAFPGCSYVPDGALVEVLADPGPGNGVMHVVRARAATFGGTVEGFTYSAGLVHYSY